MDSELVKGLKPTFQPFVVLLSDDLPEDALGPRNGPMGCIMPLIAQVIVNGKTCFTRKGAHQCGINPGLGFGDGFANKEAMEFQATFLSNGADSAKDKETYLKILETRPPRVREMFTEGERHYKDLETAMANISNRPIYNNKEKYVIFKPLSNLKEDEVPKNIVFTVNGLELGALIQLDGSRRAETNYTMTPQASACQAFGAQVWAEGEKEDPHGVIGLIDLAARKYIRKWIPDDYLTYSMPWNMFLELEELSKNSVLQTNSWKFYKGE